MSPRLNAGVGRIYIMTQKLIDTWGLTIEELCQATSDPLRVQKKYIHNKIIQKGKVTTRTSKRRADHSPTEFLPTVVCRCV